MKVVHCISGLLGGGAEMMLYKIATRVRDVETQVVAITSDEPIGARIRQAGIPVTALGKTPGRPDPRALWRLRDLLRRERPDVLQTWMYEANLYGLAAGVLAGVPRIVWNIRCADMDWGPYGRLSALGFGLGARLSRFPDAIVLNSVAGREFHVRNGYRPERMVVIPNGFDLEEFKPDPEARGQLRSELGVGPGAPIIGLVARFDPMKDHRCFVDAAARITSRRPDAHFVLVGEACTWENATLASLIADLAPVRSWRRRWHLLGRRDDIPRLMAGLDLMALSSITEGFPNVIGEAMACAVPCVATDVGDTALLVAETGRTTPKGDPEALADGLLALLALPPHDRAALGNAARRRIQDHYGLDRIAARYRSLYEQLVHGQEPATCVA